MHGTRSRWRVALIAAVATSASLAVAASASGGTSAVRADSQLHIGYIASAPVTAGDWEPANYGAFKKLIKITGAKPSVQDSVAYDQAEPVLRRMAASNNVVVLDSAGYGAVTLKVAPDYPNTWFVVMSDLASTKGLKNVAAWRVNWNEVGYLDGAIAGYASPNHVFGQVNSVPIPAFTRWGGGAQQAAQQLFHSKKKYLTTWINTFTDESKGKQAALALMAKGADVLFASADTAGLGSLNAVKQQHKLMIMPYVDQHKLAPKTIITSVTVNFNKAYTDLGKLLKANKLQAKLYPLNIKNGGIGLVLPFRNVPASVQSKVLKLVAKIKAGKVKISTTRQVNP